MFRSLSFRHMFPYGSWCFAADDAGGGGDGDGDGGGEGEGNGPDDLFAGDDDEGGGDGKEEQLTKVMEMLADCGIKLPDDTTPADLLDNLESALIAYKHAKEHHGIEPPAGEGAGEEGGGAAPAEEPMAATQMSLEMEALKSRVGKAEKIAAGERLKAMGVRLKALVAGGDLTKATAEAMWKDLTAKQLSLVSDDDSAVSRIIAQVDILEKEAKPRRLLREKTAEPKEEAAPEYVDFSIVEEERTSGKKAKPIDKVEADRILDETYGKVAS